MVMPKKPLEQSRYGRLTVEASVPGGWSCLCDCGVSRVVTGSHLRDGKVRSCGCLNREIQGAPKKHGQRYTRTWSIWSLMVQRCTNPKNDSFANYGARGITVCERWKEFVNFHADVGDAPAGLTLDRIDNEKGYAPGNCRWATRQQQARNTRSNRILQIGGISKPLIEWCEELGMNYLTVHARLRRGKSGAQALGIEK